MSQPATSPLIESLRAAPLPTSGIGWLDAMRRENLDAFVASGLPDARVEAWKYTALRALAQRTLTSGDADALGREVDADTLTLPGVDGPRLVFVNGVFRSDLSQLDGLPKGLTLQPLSQALADAPEPLRFTLSRRWDEPGDAFARLNAASAADGVVLRVAPGAAIQAPVHLVFAAAAADHDLAWHLRNVIELGEGARLSLIKHHVGADDAAQLATLVTDVHLHQGADLQLIQLQTAGARTSVIRRSQLRLEAGAHASVHALELGASLSRHDLQAQLLGEGAQLQTRGVFMPRARQHLDTQLAIAHQALNTTSSSLWRGVASERGRGVFRGAIVVARGADGSDATLSNKNLLLSPSAEIDTKPELEIYADEVKAAHGATVGQLDERALFYMQSRGIPVTQARGLLTAAFCRAVLDDLPADALREHLVTLLTAPLSPDAKS